MKSNTSYLARLFGYVSSSIPYFLISFFGFVLFAAAQVGAAEWLRRIVDFIENPNETVQTSKWKQKFVGSAMCTLSNSTIMSSFIKKM